MTPHGCFSDLWRGKKHISVAFLRAAEPRRAADGAAADMGLSNVDSAGSQYLHIETLFFLINRIYYTPFLDIIAITC